VGGERSPVGDPREVLYRTPHLRRLAVIGLIVLDVAVLEAVLQTMSVIPAVLQGLIVILLGGMLFGLIMTFSSFVTVTGGSEWLAVHRIRWSRVESANLISTQVLGPTPSFCSISLTDRLGHTVRLGAWAAASPRVRDHVRTLVIDAIEANTLVPSRPTCIALGIEHLGAVSDTQLVKASAVTAGRLALVTVLVGVVLAIRIGTALADSLGAAAAMGVAFAAIAATFLWWVSAPARWTNQ
jgi:hypothetical protein